MVRELEQSLAIKLPYPELREFLLESDGFSADATVLVVIWSASHIEQENRRVSEDV